MTARVRKASENLKHGERGGAADFSREDGPKVFRLQLFDG